MSSGGYGLGTEVAERELAIQRTKVPLPLTKYCQKEGSVACNYVEQRQESGAEEVEASFFDISWHPRKLKKAFGAANAL
jgi:hypothetical protein